MSNILDRVIIASFCVFPSVNSGWAGDRFCSASIKFCTDLLAASVDVIFGVLCFGKKSTVSKILLALVLGM